MVASSSGSDLGQVGLAAAEQRRKRLGDRLLDRKDDAGDAEAGRLEPLRPRRVAQHQAGLGQGEAVAQFLGLPPAVDQGGDSARLQRPPCRRRSRPGSCASRSPPGRPCRLPSRRPAPAPAAVAAVVELAEGQPLAVGDDRDRRGVERAEGVEQARQGRRQVGDDLAPRLVLGELDPAAGARHLGQHRVELAVQLARHPTLPFRFLLPPPNREAAEGGSL